MQKSYHNLAVELHKQVPCDWYHQSLKKDPLQRYWHHRRFEEVGKLIEPVNGLVLDVGCADGVFSNVIFQKAQPDRLIGIDVLDSSVKWASNHWARNKKLKFEYGDAHKLKYKSNTFDAVFCMEVLEHVLDPGRVLYEFKRVMKKNGYGIFLVPSDSLLFRSIWFMWLHFYPRGWVWRETHIQTYRNSYLPKLCKKIGFTIEQDKKFILGMLHVVKVRKM